MRILLLALFLVGCTSQSVKMTPEETKNFLTQNPQGLQALRAAQDASIVRYKHRYFDCESGQCFLIDCRGIDENINCWKSPLSEEEANALKLELLPQKASRALPSPSDYRESCLGTESSAFQRRQDCLTYLRFGINHSNGEVYQDVLNHLCNMRGARCEKDGRPFGSGNIAIPGRTLDSEHLKVPHETGVSSYHIVILVD